MCELAGAGLSGSALAWVLADIHTACLIGLAEFHLCFIILKL